MLQEIGLMFSIVMTHHVEVYVVVKYDMLNHMAVYNVAVNDVKALKT